MNQLMYLHWGQVKGSDVLVVGVGTYRGKILANRSCVGAMEQPFFVMRIPSDEIQSIENLTEKQPGDSYGTA